MVKSALVFFMTAICGILQAQTIRVGSKHFNEGYILSEITAQLLEAGGYKVERRFNLGGTVVCFEALRNDEIDLYPEYTGTIAAEILKNPSLNYQEIQTNLDKTFSLRITEPYGFSNTYALICTTDLGNKFNLNKISDLTEHPELKFGLSYEYLKRVDGWDNLKIKYNLTQKPVAIEHGLAYQALIEGKISVTDAYSTDGEISKYNLRMLEDDLNFFPEYQAVTLYRSGLPPEVQQIIKKLAGAIDEKTMRAMNAAVLFGNKSITQVANSFLKEKMLSGNQATGDDSVFKDIALHTLVHLELTFVALILAIIVSIPLAIALYWKPNFASTVVNLTGLLQTIPSIALLAFMIPMFGIGVVPAVVALFLYALLPILRNTLSGLQSVDPLLKNVADGIGMNRYQKLRIVELPLSTPAIMAGIRTAAVINVGTATLAAFIGAGGLGEFIVSGLALNNTSLILQGAIPAALLAISLELGFGLLLRALTPRHFINR